MNVKTSIRVSDMIESVYKAIDSYTSYTKNLERLKEALAELESEGFKRYMEPEKAWNDSKKVFWYELRETSNKELAWKIRKIAELVGAKDVSIVIRVPAFDGEADTSILSSELRRTVQSLGLKVYAEYVGGSFNVFLELKPNIYLRLVF